MTLETLYMPYRLIFRAIDQIGEINRGGVWVLVLFGVPGIFVAVPLETNIGTVLLMAGFLFWLLSWPALISYGVEKGVRKSITVSGMILLYVPVSALFLIRVSRCIAS